MCIRDRFNASRRAVKTLEQAYVLSEDELKGVKKVLRAAAMTYLAATFTALWSLLLSLIHILKRYYDADLEAGRISRDEAVFYIACLLLNDPHYYQIGGTDENGEPLLSEFSYMVLEGADKLDSACNITVRVDRNIDRKFLHKAVDYLFKNKNGWPRFSGDEEMCIRDRVYSSDDYPLPAGRSNLAEEVFHHLETGEPLHATCLLYTSRCV